MRDLLAELTRSVTRENEQLQLALKYLVNCRHRDARTACLSVVEQNPQLALGQLVLGYILMQEGDFSAAIEKLRTALALDAGLGLAHLCIGVIMLELMKLDEAISEARAAVNTDADNGVYQAFLGELYFQAGLDGPAAEALQNALRSNPYDVASHYKLANIYLKEGRDSEALRETVTALRSSPSYNSYLTLGNLRLAQQRYPEALEEYVRAMRINPVGPEVHMRVGQVCAMLGDYEVALLEIRTALKARPRHALSLYLLGGAVPQAGQVC